MLGNLSIFDEMVTDSVLAGKQASNISCPMYILSTVSALCLTKEKKKNYERLTDLRQRYPFFTSESDKSNLFLMICDEDILAS